MKCYACGADGDLRPYGPRGQMVCFDCGMKTPEQYEQAFALQLNACGPAAVVDGSHVGPYPVDVLIRVLIEENKIDKVLKK